jgi:hypothetical protein
VDADPHGAVHRFNREFCRRCEAAAAQHFILALCRCRCGDSAIRTRSFFEFSLCLSRACLGKIIIYINEWLKRSFSYLVASMMRYASRACVSCAAGESPAHCAALSAAIARTSASSLSSSAVGADPAAGPRHTVSSAGPIGRKSRSIKRPFVGSCPAGKAHPCSKRFLCLSRAWFW